jgi:hypothetical protein
MKTTIYTYKNKKPVFFDLPRFYKIKSAKQYENLIQKLLDIDAVTSPHSPDEVEIYPIYLELRSGFAPSLDEVTKKHIQKQIKKLKKLVK